jgi:hypothetical protein
MASLTRGVGERSLISYALLLREPVLIQYKQSMHGRGDCQERGVGYCGSARSRRWFVVRGTDTGTSTVSTH